MSVARADPAAAVEANMTKAGRLDIAIANAGIVAIPTNQTDDDQGVAQDGVKASELGCRCPDT
jgi:NAD(P)-dependent dehydrogenase (short-subunit alcohol dehydrogenase family)